MSRIRLNIERLVLNGFAPAEARALANALRSQLQQVLLERTGGERWARPYRTPLLRLGPLPLEAGIAGTRRLGLRVGQAIGKRLKP